MGYKKMQKCETCGTENLDTATACVSCGRRLWGTDAVYPTSSPYGSGNPEVNYGDASNGWFWLGVINFIAGFILRGALQRKMPDAADKAGRGAKIGVILSIIGIVVYILYIMSSFSKLMSYGVYVG